MICIQYLEVFNYHKCNMNKININNRKYEILSFFLLLNIHWSAAGGTIWIKYKKGEIKFNCFAIFFGGWAVYFTAIFARNWNWKLCCSSPRSGFAFDGFKFLVCRQVIQSHYSLERKIREDLYFHLSLLWQERFQTFNREGEGTQNLKGCFRRTIFLGHSFARLEDLASSRHSPPLW